MSCARCGSLISMQRACVAARARARGKERSEEAEKVRAGDGCSRCGRAGHPFRHLEGQCRVVERMWSGEAVLVASLRFVNDLEVCVLGMAKVEAALRASRESLFGE